MISGLILEEEDIELLCFSLQLLLESKELDRYNDGYKTYGAIQEFLKVLRKEVGKKPKEAKK